MKQEWCGYIKSNTNKTVNALVDKAFDNQIDAINYALYIMKTNQFYLNKKMVIGAKCLLPFFLIYNISRQM